MIPSLKALVLAAGKGTRLHTGEDSPPKVLRQVNGRALLDYVLSALSFLPRQDVILVVGWKKEAVRATFPDYPCAVQEEQLGTGHAVACAAPLLAGQEGHVLVCCGDTPLLRQETFLALARVHAEEGNACTLLSARLEEPRGYGRVLRDADGSFSAIVEEKDCTPEQRTVREVNTGVYLFHIPALLSALGRLSRDNAQGEYYLTDTPAILKGGGLRVGLCDTCSPAEMLGVNTMEQLREVEQLLNKEEEHAGTQ